MELIFNPSGEFRSSTECPVSQIHSPHLHVGASLDLFRSFKVCSDATEIFISGKTAALVQSILTYSTEVWQIPTREIKRILSGEMDVLRRSAEKI